MAVKGALPPGLNEDATDVCGHRRKVYEAVHWRPPSDHKGQDVAEYAVLLSTILLLVVGTAPLVGPKANEVFSTVANLLQSAPSDSD
jgi:hypothetical protein